jgi:hypothetical protein
MGPIIKFWLSRLFAGTSSLPTNPVAPVTRINLESSIAIQPPLESGHSHLTDDETEFIHSRDSFYIATITETNWVSATPHKPDQVHHQVALLRSE